ncbi:unnamed protein product [Boreogadus saida]
MTSTLSKAVPVLDMSAWITTYSPLYCTVERGGLVVALGLAAKEANSKPDLTISGMLLEGWRRPLHHLAIADDVSGSNRRCRSPIL